MGSSHKYPAKHQDADINGDIWDLGAYYMPAYAYLAIVGYINRYGHHMYNAGYQRCLQDGRPKQYTAEVYFKHCPSPEVIEADKFTELIEAISKYRHDPDQATVVRLDDHKNHRGRTWVYLAFVQKLYELRQGKKGGRIIPPPPQPSCGSCATAAEQTKDSNRPTIKCPPCGIVVGRRQPNQKAGCYGCKTKLDQATA